MTGLPDFRDLDRYFRPAIGENVLRPGAVSLACANLRYALGLLGFPAPDSDGPADHFTPALSEAVRAFQISAGHASTDGLCGPGTASRIVSALLAAGYAGAFQRGLVDPQRRRDGQIFLSYASADRPAMMVLANLLRGWGFTTWYDAAGLDGGSKWETALQDNLDRAYIVVVLLSRASLASPWVKNEIGYAEVLGLPVLPILLETLPAGHELTQLLANRQLISPAPVDVAAPGIDVLTRLHQAVRNAHAARRLEPPIPPA